MNQQGKGTPGSSWSLDMGFPLLTFPDRVLGAHCCCYLLLLAYITPFPRQHAGTLPDFHFPLSKIDLQVGQCRFSMDKNKTFLECKI